MLTSVDGMQKVSRRSVLSLVLTSLLLACAAGVLAHVHEHWLRRAWQRAALLVAVMIVLLPTSARTAPEWEVGTVFAVVSVLAAYAVVRWLWRGNALAYVLAAGTVLGLPPALELLSQPLGEARMQGAVVLAVAAAVLAAVAVRAKPQPITNLS